MYIPRSQLDQQCRCAGWGRTGGGSGTVPAEAASSPRPGYPAQTWTPGTRYFFIFQARSYLLRLLFPSVSGQYDGKIAERLSLLRALVFGVASTIAQNFNGTDKVWSKESLTSIIITSSCTQPDP